MGWEGVTGYKWVERYEQEWILGTSYIPPVKKIFHKKSSP